MSKYLLFEEKWAIYSYIFWENKLILCSTMTHYPNWERNGLLLLHINDVCLTEKQHIPMFIFGGCVFRQTIGTHFATNYVWPDQQTNYDLPRVLEASTSLVITQPER